MSWEKVSTEFTYFNILTRPLSPLSLLNSQTNLLTSGLLLNERNKFLSYFKPLLLFDTNTLRASLCTWNKIEIPYYNQQNSNDLAFTQICNIFYPLFPLHHPHWSSALLVSHRIMRVIKAVNNILIILSTFWTPASYEWI